MSKTTYSFVPPYLPYKQKYFAMVGLYNDLLAQHSQTMSRIAQVEELVRLTHRTVDTLSDSVFSEVEKAGIAPRPDYLDCDENSADYGLHVVDTIKKVHAIAQCASILLTSVIENMEGDEESIRLPPAEEIRLPDVIYSELPDEVLAAGVAAVNRRLAGPLRDTYANTYVKRTAKLFEVPLADHTRQVLGDLLGPSEGQEGDNEDHQAASSSGDTSPVGSEFGTPHLASSQLVASAGPPGVRNLSRLLDLIGDDNSSTGESFPSHQF